MSRWDNFTFSIGARLARNEIRGFINEPNAEYRINGAYIGSEKQHLDNTTFIQHDAPNTKSREIYKGILFDEAHGVFQGKILVDICSRRNFGGCFFQGKIFVDMFQEK